MKIQSIIVVIKLISATTSAYAAPPPNSDPNSPTTAWVQSLKDFQGTPCCSAADCRRAAIRYDDENNALVWIDKQTFGPTAPEAWVTAPPHIIAGTRANGPAPDAASWACWYSGKLACLWLGSGM
jgi:hypothetical protein